SGCETSYESPFSLPGFRRKRLNNDWDFSSAAEDGSGQLCPLCLFRLSCALGASIGSEVTLPRMRPAGSHVSSLDKDEQGFLYANGDGVQRELEERGGRGALRNVNPGSSGP